MSLSHLHISLSIKQKEVVATTETLLDTSKELGQEVNKRKLSSAECRTE